MLLTNIRYYGSDHKFHEGEIRITAGRIAEVMERPEREAAGRFSSSVPTRIMPRKANAMIRLMLTARRCFHCFRGRRVCFPVAIVFPSFRENSIHYTGPRNQAGLKSPAGMEYNIRDVI